MTDQPTSGSRWEPTPPDRAAHPAPGAPAPAPAPVPAPAPRPAAADTEPSGTGLPLAPDTWAGQYPETSSYEGRRPGRRAWVAGVSAVLFLGGSAGGYAAAHRSTGDAPTPGVGTQDGDGFGPRSADPGFTAEGGNAG